MRLDRPDVPNARARAVPLTDQAILGNFPRVGQRITLYHSPNTRAVRVAFLLEELGVEYTRHPIDLPAKQNRTDEYLAIHPHGLVPALQHGDMVMFEHLAICLYLADRFPAAGLAPAVDAPERGPYLQWSVYAIASLEPPLGDIYGQGLRPADQRDEMALTAAKARLRECCEVLGTALADKPFLLGDRLTTPDILNGHLLLFARALGVLEGPRELEEYTDRLGARPALLRAM